MNAIDHYEAALKAAFPNGAEGTVFDHWNKARAEAESVEWVGLTDEERMAIPPMYSNGGQLAYAEAIEAKLKEKNT